jgi:sugar phosphate isomerase/epimerase
MNTRRQFAKTALGAIPLTSLGFAQRRVPAFASKFSGVQIGAQTYSYRSLRNPSEAWSEAAVDRLMDRVVDGFIQDQINTAEFWIAFIEPPGGPGRNGVDPKARESLRKWRTSRPLGLFERTRKKFNDAGIDLYSAMFNFSDDLSEDEIDAAFEMAKALGTNILTANCTVRSIKRAAPFADKHKMYISAHSEDAPFDPNIDGMVFGNNLVQALTYSPYMRITLDTGHFTAYGGDVVKFVREHHDRIANLHLKDRLKNHPEPHTDENTTEFGKGDAPIKEVLQLMKKEKYGFPACIEYEYPGKGTAVEEVRKCVEYAKAVLA